MISGVCILPEMCLLTEKSMLTDKNLIGAHIILAVNCFILSVECVLAKQTIISWLLNLSIEQLLLFCLESLSCVYNHWCMNKYLKENCTELCCF